MGGRCRDTSWRRQDTGWVCFARNLRAKGNVARSLGWRLVMGEREDWKEFLAEEVLVRAEQVEQYKKYRVSTSNHNS
jgi:hypothetical protein